jgi:plasmid stability protein
VNPASLTVRVSKDLVRRLEARALAHGRSVKAEHRSILEAALRPGLSGCELWQKLASVAPAEIDFEDGADETPESVDFE